MGTDPRVNRLPFWSKAIFHRPKMVQIVEVDVIHLCNLTEFEVETFPADDTGSDYAL